MIFRILSEDSSGSNDLNYGALTSEDLIKNSFGFHRPEPKEIIQTLNGIIWSPTELPRFREKRDASFKALDEGTDIFLLISFYGPGRTIRIFHIFRLKRTENFLPSNFSCYQINS